MTWNSSIHLASFSYQYKLCLYKKHDNAEFPASFSATDIKQVLDGEEILELDYMANIFRVSGEDMLDTYRQSVGG